MNPPFGASSKTTEDYISANTQTAHKNLFAAFVINSLDHLCQMAVWGAITDRAFFLSIVIRATVSNYMNLIPLLTWQT